MPTTDGMGHIVFAAPDLGRFHLLERLRRELLRRRHRVTVLCSDRRRLTFWRAQVDDVDLLVPQRHLASAAERWLDRAQPDLLLFHQHRSPAAAQLQAAAERRGARVLWTGDGLLPHTLQADAHGLDGDAGSRRFGAADYRCVDPEPQFLAACLAHALGRVEPAGLPRAEVRVPPRSQRLRDALACVAAGRFAEARVALSGWRAALPAAPTTLSPPPTDLPVPFVALLLQHAHDPRLTLDLDETRTAPPRHPRELVRAALDAATAVDARLVVVPPAGSSARLLRALPAMAPNRLRIVPPEHASTVAATALATITANHPLAVVALLAGTPLVHTGRALYELEGVSTRATSADLAAALRSALAAHRPAIRRRFLTWLLRHGHVWCSAEEPSFNGIRGLVARIEHKLDDRPDRPLAHRAGPPWPMTAP
ncbi:MAG TPA: hypothetical protein ENI87_11960 [bacterium]|nr:hypothetical protein [bacterium]